MKLFLFTLLLLPVLTFAQEGGQVTIGDRTVAYDSSEVRDGNAYYFNGADLVASEHPGSAFVYVNDQAVLEAHDTTGDGSVDTFVSLDTNGQQTSVTGEGVDKFTKGEPTEFADLVAEKGGSEAAAQDDLVGSLDRITIPGGGIPAWTYILWIVILGGGYWLYKKRKNET